MNAPQNSLSPFANLLTVKLSVSKWSASKTDKKAAASAAQAHGAALAAVSASRRLMATADSRAKAVNKAANQIRDYLYSVSSPAGDDKGLRLIPASQAKTIVQELENRIRAHKAKVDEFLDHYESDKAKALAALGDLGNEKDYPDRDKLAQTLVAEYTLRPLIEATAIDRASIPAAFADQLIRAQQQENEQLLNAARKDATVRLVAEIDRISAILRRKQAGAETRVHATLQDEYQSLLALLDPLTPSRHASREALDKLPASIDPHQTRDGLQATIDKLTTSRRQLAGEYDLAPPAPVDLTPKKPKTNKTNKTNKADKTDKAPTPKAPKTDKAPTPKDQGIELDAFDALDCLG